MGWREDEIAYSQKIISEAKRGLYGNAGAEVIAKHEQTIKNLTGQNKTPVYVGAGSTYDQAIKKKVQERKTNSSNPVQQVVATPSVTSLEDRITLAMQRGILIDTGKNYIVKVGSRNISINYKSIGNYLDDAGNYIEPADRLYKAFGEGAEAVSQYVPGGTGGNPIMWIAGGLLLLKVLIH